MAAAHEPMEPAEPLVEPRALVPIRVLQLSGVTGVLYVFCIHGVSPHSVPHQFQSGPCCF